MSVLVGETVELLDGRVGRVLYVEGQTLGLELLNATGQHDGVNPDGARLFRCKIGQGIFVSSHQVARVIPTGKGYEKAMDDKMDTAKVDPAVLKQRQAVVASLRAATAKVADSRKQKVQGHETAQEILSRRMTAKATAQQRSTTFRLARQQMRQTLSHVASKPRKLPLDILYRTRQAGNLCHEHFEIVDVLPHGVDFFKPPPMIDQLELQSRQTKAAKIRASVQATSQKLKVQMFPSNVLGRKRNEARLRFANRSQQFKVYRMKQRSPESTEKAQRGDTTVEVYCKAAPDEFGVKRFVREVYEWPGQAPVVLEPRRKRARLVKAAAIRRHERTMIAQKRAAITPDVKALAAKRKEARRFYESVRRDFREFRKTSPKKKRFPALDVRMKSPGVKRIERRIFDVAKPKVATIPAAALEYETKEVSPEAVDLVEHEVDTTSTQGYSGQAAETTTKVNVHVRGKPWQYLVIFAVGALIGVLGTAVAARQ